MANESENLLPNRFRRGRALEAADLNKLLDALIRRMVGADPILVRTSGKQVTIGIRDLFPTFINEMMVGTITNEISDGLYDFIKYKGPDPASGALGIGPGPPNGKVQELNKTTGIPDSTNILMYRAGGSWFFQDIQATSGDGTVDDYADGIDGDVLLDGVTGGCGPVDLSGKFAFYQKYADPTDGAYTNGGMVYYTDRPIFAKTITMAPGVSIVNLPLGNIFAWKVIGDATTAIRANPTYVGLTTGGSPQPTHISLSNNGASTGGANGQPPGQNSTNTPGIPIAPLGGLGSLCHSSGRGGAGASGGGGNSLQVSGDMANWLLGRLRDYSGIASGSTWPAGNGGAGGPTNYGGAGGGCLTVFIKDLTEFEGTFDVSGSAAIPGGGGGGGGGGVARVWTDSSVTKTKTWNVNIGGGAGDGGGTGGSDGQSIGTYP